MTVELFDVLGRPRLEERNPVEVLQSLQLLHVLNVEHLIVEVDTFEA